MDQASWQAIYSKRNINVTHSTRRSYHIEHNGSEIATTYFFLYISILLSVRYANTKFLNICILYDMKHFVFLFTDLWYSSHIERY